MLELIVKLVTQTISVGKNIVIEDLVNLDSNKKQKKTTSKDYNQIINSLKFGLFKRCLLRKVTKEGVAVHSVNPYNKSKIARKSYTNRMKLNVHDTVSYVIARRFLSYLIAYRTANLIRILNERNRITIKSYFFTENEFGK